VLEFRALVVSAVVVVLLQAVVPLDLTVLQILAAAEAEARGIHNLAAAAVPVSSSLDAINKVRHER
jgi:hypothetical protein